jgi:crossover junction endodeoxyribonuclease RuvC
MTILGIDPGFAIVGWGVISTDGTKHKAVAYGAVTTPAHSPMEARLLAVFRELEQIIEKYRPDVMSVEELFFNTNITTGIRVAEARGVIIMCAEKHGVAVREYTPLQVKQAVVGYGRAEKSQVISMVTRILGLGTPPKPDDTADALALAVCHAHAAPSRLASYYDRKDG